MSRPIQVTIWGATGFTGRLVAHYLSKRLAVAVPSAKWAIAGRDHSKLQRIAEEVGLGGCASAPEIVIGSSADQASIDAIVRQASRTRRVRCALQCAAAPAQLWRADGSLYDRASWSSRAPGRSAFTVTGSSTPASGRRM